MDHSIFAQWRNAGPLKGSKGPNGICNIRGIEATFDGVSVKNQNPDQKGEIWGMDKRK